MNVPKVKDIMTPYVECVSPITTIQDAAEKMKAMDVGALLICDKDRLVGIITDRDITVRSTAAGRDPIIERRPDQAGDVPLTSADLTVAGRELGYRPKVGIEEGIQRFARWYEETYGRQS